MSSSSHFVLNKERTNTLTSNPLAPLLNRLFEAAAAVSPLAVPGISALSSDERAQMMRSKTDYLELYGRLEIGAAPLCTVIAVAHRGLA